MTPWPARKTRRGVLFQNGTIALSGPELVEPEIEPVEALGVDCVDAFGALGFHADEVGIEERLQVLGDRRAADRQALGQFVDRARGAGQGTGQAKTNWTGVSVGLNMKMICTATAKHFTFSF